MKTLIFSDLHIGDSRLRNEERIVNMLENEKYDRIIMNGDIIDCWMWGHKRAAKKSKVVKKIIELAKKIPVIWVAGNHDPVKEDQKLIPGAQVFNTYRFDKHYLALHGHQVYPFYDRAWYSKIASNINCFLYRWFRIDLQFFIRHNFVYEERTRLKREQLLDNFGNPDDTLFMGHTHMVGTQYKESKAIYDSGSIMTDGTYIIVTKEGKVKHKKL